MTKSKKQNVTRSRRRNVAAGFMDEEGVFHPIRASYDYSAARAGEGRKTAKRKTAKRKPSRPATKSKQSRKKRNVAAGFMDEEGVFHPIRASYDYSAARAGEGRKSGKTRRSKSVSRKRPKSSKPRRRRNPEAAADVYKMFHGRESTGFEDFEIPMSYQGNLAEIGKLKSLKVKLETGGVVELEPKGVTVAASEDKGQIYFVGGDQALELNKLGLSGELAHKDHVVIGRLQEIEYHTQKHFDGFKPIDYHHRMGEEGGRAPMLAYDTRNKLMYLVGGSYKIGAPGIAN